VRKRVHQTWNLCHLRLFFCLNFLRFLANFLPIKKAPKVSDHSDTHDSLPPMLSYGPNLLSILLFVYLILKKEFLFSNRIYVSLT
jgi:hypothetical protein